MWIVYYFGKKGLNAMGYGSILKYYKIGLVVLVLLFLCYYTYNLINDSISQIHYVCFSNAILIKTCGIPIQESLYSC
jgi:hypothetical protein